MANQQPKLKKHTGNQSVWTSKGGKQRKYTKNRQDTGENNQDRLEPGSKTRTNIRENSQNKTGNTNSKHDRAQIETNAKKPKPWPADFFFF